MDCKEVRMANKKKVLAVDDDPDMRKFVQLILSPYFEVTTGCCSDDCIKLAETVLPDAIILDVIMAHLGDGLDCLQKLRTLQTTKHIPVIMMTSVNEVYDYRSQIEESFYAYDRWLDKPVKPETLLQTVREVLGA
jgi:CheY-like chemotaxis protein